MPIHQPRLVFTKQTTTKKSKNLKSPWTSFALGALSLIGIGLMINNLIGENDHQVLPFETVSQHLEDSAKDHHHIAAFAIRRAHVDIRFDNTLKDIPYPMGDIHANSGMAADLIIRAYREVGFDFQQAIHESRTKHPDHYPQIWDNQPPNKSVDHRRVENLQTYLALNAISLKKQHFRRLTGIW